MKGWTARGHAGYSGYAWYRTRVQVAAQPGEKLALLGRGEAHATCLAMRVAGDGAVSLANPDTCRPI